MIRRIGGRSLALLTLGLTAIPLTGFLQGGTASALAPAAAAYWVKLGAAVPTVPPGGLLIGNDPTSEATSGSQAGQQLPVPVTTPPGVQHADVIGPTAISAVRITGVSDTAPATLTLQVAAGSIPPAPAVTSIVACPLPGGWSAPPSGVGDIAAAPGYNCAASSPGKVAADNTSISWYLPSSFQSTPGEIDVALLPDPAGAVVPFTVAFDRPGTSAVAAPEGVPSAGATAGTTSVTQPAPLAGAPIAGAPIAGGLSSPFVDTSPASAPADAGSASLPPPATSLGGTAPLPRSPVAELVPRLAGVRLPGDDRAHRIMAVVVLIALAAGWWYVGSRPARAPRLLGALATGGGTSASAAPALPVTEGGIGRFRRPRPAAGPRL